MLPFAILFGGPSLRPDRPALWHQLTRHSLHVTWWMRPTGNCKQHNLFGSTPFSSLFHSFHVKTSSQLLNSQVTSYLTEMDLPSLQLQSCSHVSLEVARSHFTLFCSCDLNLDPMVLIYEFDVTILKMYPRTNNKLPRSRLSKVIERRIDRCDWN